MQDNAQKPIAVDTAKKVSSILLMKINSALDFVVQQAKASAFSIIPLVKLLRHIFFTTFAP